jgi:hypothetical protein
MVALEAAIPSFFRGSKLAIKKNGVPFKRSKTRLAAGT